MAGIKTPPAAKRGRRRSKGFPRHATEGAARRGKPAGCATAQASQRSAFAAQVTPPAQLMAATDAG